mgnify:CR=1 FL=1
MKLRLLRTKKVSIRLATGVLATVTFAQISFAVAALNPPLPYVLAEDGVTQQTLEEAGILNAVDGRKYGITLGKALFWDSTRIQINCEIRDNLLTASASSGCAISMAIRISA